MFGPISLGQRTNKVLDILCVQHITVIWALTEKLLSYNCHEHSIQLFQFIGHLYSPPFSKVHYQLINQSFNQSFLLFLFIASIARHLMRYSCSHDNSIDQPLFSVCTEHSAFQEYVLSKPTSPRVTDKRHPRQLLISA